MGIWGKKNKRGKSAAKAASGGKRKLRDEERLRSVVEVSVPGAVLDLLRDNEKFTISDAVQIVDDEGNNIGSQDAHVVLILPTQTESFGGLSSKSKGDEAKGSFVNAMRADDIHSVVTEGLLDDDALAIIPDEGSLERMGEYSILRDASYEWGVVIEDRTTGMLEVFSIPAIERRINSSTGALEPLLFAEAEAVSAGVKDLSSVISPDVVAAMCEIFFTDDVVDEDGEVITAYGSDGLSNAMDMNMDLMGSQLEGGGYPTSDEFMAQLVHKFPELGRTRFGDYVGLWETMDVARREEEVAEEIPVAEQTREFDVIVDDDEPDFLADDDAAAASGDDDGADVAAGDADEPDFAADDEPDFSDDVDGDVAADGEVDEEPLREIPDVEGADDAAASASVPVVAGGLSEERLLDVLSEHDSRSREEIKEVLQGFMSDFAAANRGMPTLDQVRAANDANYTFADVTDAASLRYSNDELGLKIDLAHAEASLFYASQQLLYPDNVEHTPWLTEQVHAMIAEGNAQLAALNSEHLYSLQQEYIMMMSMAADECSEAVDLTKDNIYARFVEALDRDGDQWREDAHKRADEHGRELRAEKAEEKKKAIEAKVAEYGAEWDRRYGNSWDRRIERECRVIEAAPERHMETKRAEMLAMRREDAQRMYQNKATDVAKSLLPRANERMEDEKALREEIVKQINDFMRDNRENDIHVANVRERALNADTRVEQALTEKELAIKQVTDEMARLKEEFSRREAENTADFKARLETERENNRLAVESEKNRSASLETMLAQLKVDRDAEREETKKQHAAELEAAESTARRMQQVVDADDKARKMSMSMMILIMVVIAIIFALGGFMFALAVL